MKRALVLYVKSPRVGSVKTRLTFGEGSLTVSEAALFYESLLLDILSLFSSFSSTHKYDFFLCPKDKSFSDDLGISSSISVLDDRGGGDLGASMYYSIDGLISSGYSSVCIVGSDIPFFTIDLLMRAFFLLRSYDLVFGPSYDGGTYLIGSSGNYSIFSDIEWSRGDDFSILCGRGDSFGLSYSVLDSLMDIDRMEDLLKFKDIALREGESFANRMPRTYSFFIKVL